MESNDPMTPDDPCGAIRRDAFEYAADPGELPESRRREIRRHAEACPSCDAHLRSAAALEAALPLWEAPRPGPDFCDRVTAAAEASSGGGPSVVRRLLARRVSLPLPLAIAAGLLVMALLALEFAGPGRPGGPGAGGRGEADFVTYSADVAAPAALTLVSGPDPALVGRVLRAGSAGTTR